MQRQAPQDDKNKNDRRSILTDERDEDLGTDNEHTDGSQSHQRRHSDPGSKNDNANNQSLLRGRSSGFDEVAEPLPELRNGSDPLPFNHNLRNAIPPRSHLPVHPESEGQDSNASENDRSQDELLLDLLRQFQGAVPPFDFIHILPTSNARQQPQFSNHIPAPQQDTMLRLLTDIRDQLAVLNARSQQTQAISITLPQSLFGNQPARLNQMNLMQTAYQVGVFMLVCGMVNGDTKLLGVGLTLAIAASFINMMSDLYDNLHKAGCPVHNNRPR